MQWMGWILAKKEGEMMLRSKIFWSICLLVAVSLFLASLVEQNLWLLLGAGIVATITYFLADDVLFAEYNQKRELKRQKLQKAFDDRRKKE
ncbi:hypothetical protein FC32_GL001082 [Ligilactobacillus apodemi DSM 16634 = JCM 16172]|uniref:Uncharacterized protein n=2 Tax=Ligilactobacillus TaxID=2767887 RepID=A0A0R1TQU9_9LACO|nr:hypothetical protein FC32_GL001082 [Ligilactobacillus apodemi DSM 16634 = JCM 16172]